MAADSVPLPKSPKFINLIGHPFGRLTVLSYAGLKGHHTSWLCLCACGTQVVIVGYRLTGGSRTKSCGCLQSEVASKLLTTHGETKTPTYRLWHSMLDRCYLKSCSCYARYGGRGITVYQEWMDDYASFREYLLASIGERPSKKHSLDRINNELGYEPGNLRWATASEQARNRRSNRRLEYAGRIQSISAWSDETGIPGQTIRARVVTLGWTVEKALTTPLK